MRDSADEVAAARYDVLILGGGVAGCVLAARLSENPDRSVCLVEAGPDYGADRDAWPPTVVDARVLSRDDVWEKGAAPYRIRARILGGSSCVNGCWHAWGSPSDYADWAQAGGPAWSAAGLEPFRRAAARKMRLRTVPEREMSVWSTAALAAADDLGYPRLPNLAVPTTGPGCGCPQVNALDGLRWNAAFAYLGPARRRPNLTVLTGATADRLVVTRGAVQGVELDLAGQRIRVAADRYVLCCGAFGSPAVLMRSGIGPPEHLAAVGIRTEVGLPGVGANLADHPGVFVPLAPSAELNAALAAKDTAGDLYVSRVAIRAASAYCADGAWDLHVLPIAGPPLFGHLPPGEYEAGICAFVVKPVSRGRVRLRAADPAAPLDIDPEFLSDPDGRDVSVLRTGLAIAGELIASRPLKSLASPRWSGAPEDLSDGDLRARLGTYWHPVGTCAMGTDSDPAVVVDGAARVHGLTNLHVVDASILPTVPAANTQLSVLAVAEMLADALS